MQFRFGRVVVVAVLTDDGSCLGCRQLTGVVNGAQRLRLPIEPRALGCGHWHENSMALTAAGVAQGAADVEQVVVDLVLDVAGHPVDRDLLALTRADPLPGVGGHRPEPVD